MLAPIIVVQSACKNYGLDYRLCIVRLVVVRGEFHNERGNFCGTDFYFPEFQVSKSQNQQLYFPAVLGEGGKGFLAVIVAETYWEC